MKISKFNFDENFMLETRCLLNIFVRFFHWLICILFHVKTQYMPEQHLKPIQSQNALSNG